MNLLLKKTTQKLYIWTYLHINNNQQNCSQNTGILLHTPNTNLHQDQLPLVLAQQLTKS